MHLSNKDNTTHWIVINIATILINHAKNVIDIGNTIAVQNQEIFHYLLTEKDFPKLNGTDSEEALSELSSLFSGNSLFIQKNYLLHQRGTKIIYAIYQALPHIQNNTMPSPIKMPNEPQTYNFLNNIYCYAVRYTLKTMPDVIKKLQTLNINNRYQLQILFDQYPDLAPKIAEHYRKILLGE